MNDFNIEFAHIYADKNLGEEQIKSIFRLKETIKDMKKNKKSFVTAVLIDEYSPNKNTLEEENFLKKLKEEGASPDFIAYESTLCEIAEDVINLIPENLLRKQKFKDKEVVLLNLKDKQIGLKDSSGKYTCSLLIVAWILVRFGILKISNLRMLENKEFSASQLITILPSKYKETEEKVLDILKSTKYKELKNKITYHFF